MQQKLEDNVTIKVYQQDWIPGFAALISYEDREATDNAHVVLNLGSLLALVEQEKDFEPADIPYIVCESLMHEIAHALEQWAFVEFSEEKVEQLTEMYRQKYHMDGEE